jgi:hypothetical protein
MSEDDLDSLELTFTVNIGKQLYELIENGNEHKVLLFPHSAKLLGHKI